MRWTLAAVAFVILAATLSPLAAADEDSLKVIVLVENKVYSMGATGKITVQVYDKAKLTDSDSTPVVKIGTYPQRDLSVTKKSTGIYEGTFTIRDGDAFAGSYVGFTASATIGKVDANDTSYNEDTGYASIYLSGGSTGFAIKCYIKAVSSNVIVPGTRITVAAEATHNGTAVVPTNFNITVSYTEPSGNRHMETPTTNNPTTGVLECIYTVPQIAYSTSISFDAKGDYKSETQRDSTSVSLDFFCVIYHNVSKSTSETTFDLYVADTNGKPVSGAHIDLAYYPDGQNARTKWKEIGITESSGKVRVTLSYDVGTKYIDVYGYVNGSGLMQILKKGNTHRIWISHEVTSPKPSGSEFETVYAGTEDVYKPGQVINRDYVVFNDSKAWVSKTLYCYILQSTYSSDMMSSQVTSVDVRILTTDANGRMRLTITAPGTDTYFSVYFESATGVHPPVNGYFNDHVSMDGLLYSEDSDYFVASKSYSGKAVDVKISSLNVGSSTTVKATAKSTDEPVAAVLWYVGDIDPLESGVPDLNWMPWQLVYSYMTKSGSSYSGSIVIPSFMPKGEKYSVLVLVQRDGSSTYGLATLKPGQGTTPAAGFPWLIVGIVLVVVIVAVGVVAFMMMKRKRATQLPPYSYSPQGAPPAAQPGPSEPQPYTPPATYAGPAQPPAAQPYQPPTAQPGPAYSPPPQPGASYSPPPQPAPAYSPPPAVPAPQPYYPPPAQPAPQGYQAPPPAPQAQPQSYSAIQPPHQPMPATSAIPNPNAESVNLPNDAICGYCHQWLLTGSKGLLCSCGKYYHENCGTILKKCPACSTQLQK